jgi:hypothetical protein
MRNIIYVAVAILLLSSCAKTSFTTGRLTNEKVYVEQAIKQRGDTIRKNMSFDLTKALYQANLDSLIQARGYWLWLDVAANGNIIAEYEEGEFGPITCDTALMRNGVLSYGTATMSTEVGTFNVSVTVWPDNAFAGSYIIEMTSYNSWRTWYLRADNMQEGMGLAYPNAFDGYAIEGIQTGTVPCYFRDPDGFFYEVTTDNTISCTVSMTNGLGTYFGQLNYGRFTFWGGPGVADYVQITGIAIYACDLSIEHPDFPIESNRYFGRYRLPGGLNVHPLCIGIEPDCHNYQLQPGEILGEYINN